MKLHWPVAIKATNNKPKKHNQHQSQSKNPDRANKRYSCTAVVTAYASLNARQEPVNTITSKSLALSINAGNMTNNTRQGENPGSLPPARSPEITKPTNKFHVTSQVDKLPNIDTANVGNPM